MEETLEKSLVDAGLDALRSLGGEALVQIMLDQAGELGLADANGSERVPIDSYLRYRDTALEFLQESFCSTAFQTGQFLVRSLKHGKRDQIQWLLTQYSKAASKLPLIGQAAVLAAKDNPGVVRATMRGRDVLVITIENCPECRKLRRDAPICYINQGVISEFAAHYLQWPVHTTEVKCMVLGDAYCEIEVRHAPEDAS